RRAGTFLRRFNKLQSRDREGAVAIPQIRVRQRDGSRGYGTRLGLPRSIPPHTAIFLYIVRGNGPGGPENFMKISSGVLISASAAAVLCVAFAQEPPKKQFTARELF